MDLVRSAILYPVAFIRKLRQRKCTSNFFISSLRGFENSSSIRYAPFKGSVALITSLFCPVHCATACLRVHRDVQSLHNRLSVVEGSVAALPKLVASLTASTASAVGNSNAIPSSSSSSGTGPAGPSAHSDPTSQSSKSGPRMLAVSPNGASVVVNLDTTAGLWISDLEAELGREGPRFDLRPVDSTSKHHKAPATIANKPSQPETAKELLERHIGLKISPTCSSTTATLESDPYNDIVAELLAQFPTELAREHLLRKFEIVIQRRGAWCMPINVFKEQLMWLMSFAPDDKGKGKAKNASVNGEGEVDGYPSLALVASAAVGLAIGGLCWIAEDDLRPPDSLPTSMVNSPGSFPPSPPAHAFGIQRGTPYALYRLARLALNMHHERHGYAALDETYLIAQIMIVGYLLLAHREDGTMLGPHPASPLPLSLPPDLPLLIAELCCNARLMGLNTDPDDFASFGDIPGSISSSSVRPGAQEDGSSVKAEESSGPEGLLEGRWGRMSLYRKEVRRRLWWEIAYVDMVVSENLGIVPNFRNDECTTRIPSYIDDDHFGAGSRSSPSRDEESQATVNFFLVRCQ